MADRAASASSLRTNTGPVLNIKVTHYELDPEIRMRRSITSDNFPTGGMCLPVTVIEATGGIIRCVGFVDPTDAFVLLLLASIGKPVLSSDFDYASVQLVLDVKTESAASRYGYTFGATSGSYSITKIIPMGLTGRTDDAGMIEASFEIHSQRGITWATNLT